MHIWACRDTSRMSCQSALPPCEQNCSWIYCHWISCDFPHEDQNHAYGRSKCALWCVHRNPSTGSTFLGLARLCNGIWVCLSAYKYVTKIMNACMNDVSVSLCLECTNVFSLYVCTYKYDYTQNVFSSHIQDKHRTPYVKQPVLRTEMHSRYLHTRQKQEIASQTQETCIRAPWKECWFSKAHATLTPDALCVLSTFLFIQKKIGSCMSLTSWWKKTFPRNGFRSASKWSCPIRDIMLYCQGKKSDPSSYVVQKRISFFLFVTVSYERSFLLNSRRGWTVCAGWRSKLPFCFQHKPQGSWSKNSKARTRGWHVFRPGSATVGACELDFWVPVTWRPHVARPVDEIFGNVLQ